VLGTGCGENGQNKKRKPCTTVSLVMLPEEAVALARKTGLVTLVLRHPKTVRKAISPLYR